MVRSEKLKIKNYKCKGTEAGSSLTAAD